MDDLTPMKCLRIVALFRLINPTKEIRIAGGREVTFVTTFSIKSSELDIVGDYLITGGQPNQLDYDGLTI